MQWGIYQSVIKYCGHLILTAVHKVDHIQEVIEKSFHFIHVFDAVVCCRYSTNVKW